MTDNQRIGRYGQFGGRYVSEALWAPCEELAVAFDLAVCDEEFNAAFKKAVLQRAHRPSAITELARLNDLEGGGKIYLKRDDIASPFHLVSWGYALLAKRMGKGALIADSSDGGFGLALAKAAAANGLSCEIYMTRSDAGSASADVAMIEKLGAVVHKVEASSTGRHFPLGEAMRVWSTDWKSKLLCSSSSAFADPYPRILAHFYAGIGQESVAQSRRAGMSFDYVITAVGSGGYAASLFRPWVDNDETTCVGIQAPVSGVRALGVYQGAMTLVSQDDEGLVQYPCGKAVALNSASIAPELADFAQSGRVVLETVKADDIDRVRERLLETEGITISRASGHALTYAMMVAQTSEQLSILVGLVGGAEPEAESGDE